jgi:ribosomal protein L37E
VFIPISRQTIVAAGQIIGVVIDMRCPGCGGRYAELRRELVRYERHGIPTPGVSPSSLGQDGRRSRVAAELEHALEERLARGIAAGFGGLRCPVCGKWVGPGREPKPKFSVGPKWMRSEPDPDRTMDMDEWTTLAADADAIGVPAAALWYAWFVPWNRQSVQALQLEDVAVAVATTMRDQGIRAIVPTQAASTSSASPLDHQDPRPASGFQRNDPKTDATALAFDASQPVRSCARCGRESDRRRKYLCMHCGLPFGEVQVEAQEAPSSARRTCPSCGYAKTPPDKLACYKCGRRIPPPDVSNLRVPAPTAQAPTDTSIPGRAGAGGTSAIAQRAETDQTTRPALVARLRQLQDAHDDGMISDDEFAAKRKKLLLEL